MTSTPASYFESRARVVGTIITEAFLESAAERKLPCDLVELRIDGFPLYEGWVQKGLAIERQGTPVFVTPRHAMEGGQWTGPEAERWSVYQEALEHLSGVDIEVQSAIAEQVATLARAKGKFCILSHHDFNATPSAGDLEGIIRKGQEIGTVVKIAAMVQSAADLETLRSILRQSWKVPICLIGMGPLGRETRLTFPKEGSCLTYGYLDQAGAPGQYSAEELMRVVGGQL